MCKSIKHAIYLRGPRRLAATHPLPERIAYCFWKVVLGEHKEESYSLCKSVSPGEVLREK